MGNKRTGAIPKYFKAGIRAFFRTSDLIAVLLSLSVLSLSFEAGANDYDMTVRDNGCEISTGLNLGDPDMVEERMRGMIALLNSCSEMMDRRSASDNISDDVEDATRQLFGTLKNLQKGIEQGLKE